MNKLSAIIMVFLLVNLYQGILSGQTTHAEPETLSTGSEAPDFSLPGVDGKTYSPGDFSKSPVLPYLYDGDKQKTALAYGPVATPHCFVFDKARILRYNGRIDGSEKPGTGKAEDLRNAVDAVLSGQPVTTPVTKVFGCSVKWSWKNEYTVKLYEQWAKLPVTLEEIDVNGVRELIKNTSSNKLRLINIWATWCGPCKTEFPDLVIIDRMYRGRDFEFITISADKQQRMDDALKFLKSQQASNKNYIFNDDDVYKLIDA
ncbi:MAG: redoxin, partial [Bacteroidetes bacterium]|nr:redoxin [Bacteroidota bacterium]